MKHPTPRWRATSLWGLGVGLNSPPSPIAVGELWTISDCPSGATLLLRSVSSSTAGRATYPQAHLDNHHPIATLTPALLALNFQLNMSRTKDPIAHSIISTLINNGYTDTEIARYARLTRSRINQIRRTLPPPVDNSLAYNSQPDTIKTEQKGREQSLATQHIEIR